MKTQEFIENLKKIYENCSIYFDIQEKSLIVKNEITKEQKKQWDEKEPELRKIRIQLQELKVLGVDDLPEPPPQRWEDVWDGDSKYQLGEEYFQWLITKLDEWEINQNKTVENISSLIEFLEWATSEEEEFDKKIRESREKLVEEMFLSLITSRLEQKKEELVTLLKSIHPEFTSELHSQWENNGFDYDQTREWINIGLKPNESNYAVWLRDICNLSPDDFLYLNADGEKLLHEQYQEYLKESEVNESEDEETLLSKAMSLSLENDEDNSEKDNHVRNILLIGRTGNGKSTLGNVLLNKNDNFEEIFKQSSKSISKTKHLQAENFTIDIDDEGKEKVHYLVIDTAGFGDTELDTKEILSFLKDLIPIIKEKGLNQIFFVTGGRFTQQELDVYNLLKSVIFDKDVVNYTTIIRTNFPEFEDGRVCQEDKKSLREENSEIFEILKNSEIIYVDHPRMIGRSADRNREIREESRKRLLTYLGTCQDNYYPSNLDTLSQRIDNYITAEEELKREISLKEQKISEEETKLQKEKESIQKQKDRELKMTERNFERQKQWLTEEIQKKLQTTQQEFEEVHQNQLKGVREAHDKAVREINQAIQNNLNQIREIYNRVRVGEPVCRYGHDRDIKVYDKSGCLIPDYQSDFVGHVYCPTCGRNDYEFTLKNAQTYTLDEWSRRNAQHAAEKRRKMQEAIDEQNRKEREIISRINQERKNREAENNRKLQERQRLENQIIEQYRKINEERQNLEKQAHEGKINSSTEERIQQLERELVNKKQALENHLRQSEIKRNQAQQELLAYIEQRR